MAFEQPLYILRAGGEALVAWSLHELLELIDCALAEGDHVDMIHTYYGREWPLSHSRLASLVRALTRP